MKKLLLFFLLICLTSFANAQWVQTSLDSVYIYSFAIKGDSVFAGSEQNGLYFSPNNGSNWDTVNAGLNYMNGIFSIVMKKDTMFAGALGDGVNLSLNYGSSWTAVNTGLTSFYITSLAIKGNNIFAGTQPPSSGCGGVYLSSDNGNNWVQVNNGLPTDIMSGYYEVITSFAVKGDTIFAGTGGGGVYMSSNNGSNWTSVNTGLIGDINALAINGSNIFAGTESGGLFLSSNNGSSWAAIGLTNAGIRALAISGNNIFAGTENGGIYLSTNNGNSWDSINTGLLNYKYISALAINGSNIFAGVGNGYIGGGKGVWKRSLSDILGIKESYNNESNIAVYPNPATNDLIIETSKQAEIKILNIQGQTILQQSLQQDKTDIDISGLAKGVYILRLCSYDKTEVARIVKE